MTHGKLLGDETVNPILSAIYPIKSQSFSACSDFCRESIHPSYVIFASGGNDSVALVYLAHLENLQNVAVAYSNTGWAASWWPLRVERFKAWVETFGFSFNEIPSKGMEALVAARKGWPANGMQFCTTELKLIPALQWLDSVDPEKAAICMVGVRRAESKKRRDWPLNISCSENHGGRELWSPLVAYSDADRDELIVSAGWEVLPHRSKECSPCVNANRATFRLLDERDIEKVASHEEKTGRTMFRPHRFMGARGIREVVRWANGERGAYEPLSESGCDSGMCGD